MLAAETGPANQSTIVQFIDDSCAKWTAKWVTHMKQFWGTAGWYEAGSGISHSKGFSAIAGTAEDMDRIMICSCLLGCF